MQNTAKMTLMSSFFIFLSSINSHEQSSSNSWLRYGIASSSILYGTINAHTLFTTRGKTLYRNLLEKRKKLKKSTLSFNPIDRQTLRTTVRQAININQARGKLNCIIVCLGSLLTLKTNAENASYQYQEVDKENPFL